MHFNTALVLALVPSVLASGATISAAMTAISTATVTLNTTISNWDGGLFGALPIVVQSTELLASINDGTNVAKASANLTETEALTVAGVTETLVTTVQSALNLIVATKPKFDHLLLSPAILINLGLEKSATDQFSAAVLAKVPPELVSIAQSIVAPVDVAFSAAITAYEQL